MHAENESDFFSTRAQTRDNCRQPIERLEAP
jgi:hypothetical protein